MTDAVTTKSPEDEEYEWAVRHFGEMEGKARKEAEEKIFAEKFGRRENRARLRSIKLCYRSEKLLKATPTRMAKAEAMLGGIARQHPTINLQAKVIAVANATRLAPSCVVRLWPQVRERLKK